MPPLIGAAVLGAIGVADVALVGTVTLGGVIGSIVMSGAMIAVVRDVRACPKRRRP